MAATFELKVRVGMSQGFVIFPTPFAAWSRRLAMFSVQLVLLTIILHRFLSLSTPVALNLFKTAFAGAALAIVAGLIALVIIWREGRSGIGSAFAGILLSLLLFAWPAVYAPLALSLPPIHDVTTDTSIPPRFVAAGRLRAKDANPIAYTGAETARLQAEFYPDIRPVVISRPAAEVYELVDEVVRRFKWTIASQSAPQARGQPGYIEAVDKTMILGFLDDVVIRIDGDARETRIDARSASRYGVHDLGRNATRVRNLFAEIKTRLDVSATGGPRRRRARPDAAVPKRQKGAPVASAVQQKGQGRGQQGAQRAQQQKERPRSRAENQARGKRSPQSQE